MAALRDGKASGARHSTTVLARREDWRRNKKVRFTGTLAHLYDLWERCAHESQEKVGRDRHRIAMLASPWWQPQHPLEDNLMKKSLAVLTALCSGLVLSGCVAADPRNPESINLGGSVSLEEYMSAFDALKDCVTEAGLIVTEPTMSPVDNARLLFGYEFNGLSPDAALAATDGCETQTWTRTSIAFTLDAVPRMNADLAAFVSDCLTERGLDTKGNENSVSAFIASAGEPHRDTVVDCVLEGARRLYPDLPSVTVGS
jgi:hypothetical protein